ncbi:MAG: hypothetical protein LQ339_002200 [Xanthoria mediterranea]|nr:MAG: hypothetical protein LQ339_002200 [Xanthoria mediterranea]
MKIATLQFSPQLGLVDENIARADSILSSCSSSLHDLDLLVLPELAFTGYNHPSLQSITPYLEPTASGPSTRWAIRTARRLGCLVTVGYPELFSPTPPPPSTLKPTMLNLGPEPETYYSLTAYNSTVTLNPRGEIVAHYRKTHLYYTDEVWAQESPDGFTTTALNFPPKERTLAHADDESMRAGVVTHTTTQAICMDLNPRHFIPCPPPSALCKHVLATETTLLALSTAWLTHLPSSALLSQPAEFDMDTLAYWCNALEPLIDGDREVICVFANRCGEEAGRVVPNVLAEENEEEERDGDGAGVRYAGSSWIGKVGGGRGKLVVGGILGRSEEAVLVVEV